MPNGSGAARPRESSDPCSSSVALMPGATWDEALPPAEDLLGTDRDAARELLRVTATCALTARRVARDDNEVTPRRRRRSSRARSPRSQRADTPWLHGLCALVLERRADVDEARQRHGELARGDQTVRRPYVTLGASRSGSRRSLRQRASPRSCSERRPITVARSVCRARPGDSSSGRIAFAAIGHVDEALRPAYAAGKHVLAEGRWRRVHTARAGARVPRSARRDALRPTR